MIYAAPLLVEQMKQQAEVQAWLDALIDVCEPLYQADGARLEARVIHDSECGQYRPQITVVAHGVPRVFNFEDNFFASGEYQSLLAMGEALKDWIGEGAHVQRGERKQPVESFEDALAWMMRESTKRHALQRYHGLGEMNPDQLWETTMDPAARRMLQVTIDDAIAADQIFTTLMGDQVEPRREFIETNALRVANLDI